MGVNLDTLVHEGQASNALFNLWLHFICHNVPVHYEPVQPATPRPVHVWLPSLVASPDSPFPTFPHPHCPIMAFLIDHGGSLVVVWWEDNTLAFYSSRPCQCCSLLVLDRPSLSVGSQPKGLSHLYRQSPMIFTVASMVIREANQGCDRAGFHFCVVQSSVTFLFFSFLSCGVRQESSMFFL